MNSVIRCNSNVWRPRTTEKYYVKIIARGGWVCHFGFFFLLSTGIVSCGWNFICSISSSEEELLVDLWCCRFCVTMYFVFTTMFVSHIFRCYSYLGKVSILSMQPQPLSLTSRCLQSRGRAIICFLNFVLANTNQGVTKKTVGAGLANLTNVLFWEMQWNRTAVYFPTTSC